MAEKTDNSDGFVVIRRKITRWEWYDVPNTCHLFIHLILRASHEKNEWHGITVNRGQLVTSIPSLSRETGLTQKQVRVALNHLKRTGEVACTTTNRYTLISIANYSQYQDKEGRQKGRQGADRGQSKGRQRATDNNINNSNNLNNENIYAPPATVEAVEEYARSLGLSVDAESFVDYNAARGWKGIADWRPLVKLAARQQPQAEPEPETDAFGRPIKEEFE